MQLQGTHDQIPSGQVPSLTGSASGTAHQGLRERHGRGISTRDLDPGGPVIRRHRLGRELRHLRESCALRLEDAAAVLGVAASTLSRIETGRAPARASYVRVLLDLYHVDEPATRTRLTDLARQGHRKGWWAEYERVLPNGMDIYLGLEAAASAICVYALQIVPALFQTPDYAAAACQAARPELDADAINALTEVTERRQDILLRGHAIHAVIDESALHRTIGSADVMASQADHLRQLAALPHVTVQVLQLSTPQPASPVPFSLISFPDAADEDAAATGELSGQITVTRRHTTVRAFRDAFNGLIGAAAPPDLTASLIDEITRPNMARMP